MVPHVSSDDTGPLPSRPPEDRVEELVAQFLDGSTDESDDAVEAFCRVHAAHAPAIRDRLKALRDAGLWGVLPPVIGEEAPESLGEFRLLRRLGGGGMGVVYLAEQPSLGRRVALKLIRPEYLYFSDSRERFRREVEAVAQLQHPGIVPIHSVGEAKGLPYFAMEHIAGSTLAEVLQRLRGRSPDELNGRDLQGAIAATEDATTQGAATRGPATRGAVEADVRTDGSDLFDGTWEVVCLRVARAVAQALDHAHERRILHRDVKPSNVMITPTGRVLLVDFGLARSEGATSLTRTGSQLGSLPYMSPEQVRGSEKSLDRRTDVYSLGVTLYELLTLHSPFDAADTEVSRGRILEGHPPPLRIRNRNLSWEAETVCLTAMEPDPARRYASAADLAREIENVLARRPIRARRAGLALRTRRWMQRHPARATALVLGTLLVVGGPSLFAWQKSRELARTLGLRLAALSTAAIASDPGLALALAIEGTRDNPGGAADDALGAALNDALGAALNACYEEKELVDSANALSWAEFSPDGRLVVTAPYGPRVNEHAQADHGVRIFDAESGSCLNVLRGHTDLVSRAHFSPDGERVVSASRDGSTRIWDVHSGLPLCVLKNHGGLVRDACFDASGCKVATISDDFLARVWDVASGELLAVMHGHTEQIDSVEFSRDGTRLLTASYDGSARLWNVGTGEIVCAYVPQHGYYHGLHAAHFSPDETRVLTASNNITPAIFDTESGESLHVLEGHEREVYDASFSPDGRRVVTASYDNTARVWDADTGALVCKLVGHRDQVHAASFDPTSSRVLTYSQDSTARLWEAETGREIASLRGQPNLASAVLDRSGERVVTAGSDGTARIWNAADGSRFFDLRAHDGRVHAIALSPDGLSLATVSADKTACIFDAHTGARQHTLRGHEQAVLSLTFSPDSQFLLTGSNDRSVRLWDVHSGNWRWALTGQELWVELHRFDARGERIATVSGGNLHVWNSATGASEWNSPQFDNEGFNGLHFLGDGRRLIANGLSLRCWDLDAQGTLVWEHRFEPDRGCETSLLLHDGHTLVAGLVDGELSLWDTETQAELRSWQAHGSDVLQIVESPDRTRIVSLGRDGTIKVWNTRDWSEVAALSGFSARIACLTCNHDASRVATISGPGVLVWSTDSPPRQLARLQRNEADAVCAVLDQTGERIYAGFSDGRVWAWTVYDDPLAAARKLAPRGLTAQERERFGLGDAGRR